jgi:hypothetical protein
VTIAQVDPENEASKTVEFEEAHRASLFYDFLNLDLLNQESLHLPTAANQACATSRRKLASLAKWAARPITHLC